ncbi:MAG: sensor domain-containing diguanylate cyclase [Actinomycetota bacterium]
MRTATFFALVVGVVLLAGSIGLGLRDQGERRRAVDQALTSKALAEAGQLEEYFARARSINLITAHNPAFQEFYEAPGTRLAKIEGHNHEVQHAENALAYLERLYPTSIGEACFIDRAGPENARFTRGVRANLDDLSKDESANPFFASTFGLRPGQVYQAKPYVSPDTHEWVISNSTPVPGTGRPAAAIVHFEITVASFQRKAAEIAKQDEVTIIEARNGKVIVNSRLAQRVGAPLGQPGDGRFAELIGQGGRAGTTTIGGHQAAFRRLQQTPHNENDWYVVAVDPHAAGTLLQAAGGAPLGMAVGALFLLLLSAITFRGARRALREDEQSRDAEARRSAAERDYHETQRAFTEVMQITRDEHEAYRLLERHLQRSLANSEVLVLNRNNSHDRLEAVTELADGSPLAESLKGAEPDSCLAVRLGKTHERSGGEEQLLVCELCGVTDVNSTCVPSLVGGEVIGSVLVQHASPLDKWAKRRVEESMTQASPVLANLRNLALSQARALTDGLTGLPNRRAADDTLKRMVAHAERLSSPLAAVLFDLDHFKQINDLFGHEKGDEVLAAIGVAVTSNLRESDFAARFGGEEFILLLPDTDRGGAVVVAEKLRQVIAAVEVVGVSRPITATLGVAVLPDEAAEATLLVRAADRATYLGKSRGRNRVETVAPDDSAPSALTLA